MQFLPTVGFVAMSIVQHDSVLLRSLLTYLLANLTGLVAKDTPLLNGVIYDGYVLFGGTVFRLHVVESSLNLYFLLRKSLSIIF